MLSRSLLATGASALAAVAGLVSQLDGDVAFVPFFIGLAVLGATGAFVVREPYTDNRRVFGAMVATVWIAVAFIIGGLLLWQRALCACSMPEPTAEATYLGLTATVYHLAGVYLGGALMAVAAFSRALAR
ncbi:MAG: hypothetical protein ACXWWU_05260 [Candidatus Limnocylindria bacterium]